MWLVVLYPGSDRDEFIEFMIDNNHVFNEFEFIPLVFEVEEPFDHPMIQMIEDGDWKQAKPAVRQDISVQPDLQGPDNWSLPRVIRRNKPWVFDSSYDGMSTFFDAGLDGTGVDIYVIDSGFNADHEDFGGRATNVTDYTTDGSNVDEFGHGTACASLAAGTLMGPAKGALLWSFRVFDANGTAASSTWIVNAINGAIAHYNSRSGLNRAAVMNLSLAGSSASVGSATEAAIAAGIVAVAAAGNDNVSVLDTNVLPANAAGVIAVGGTNPADGPYYTGVNGTNFGSRVDILAPSQGNRVADFSGNTAYKTGNGTSYGCGVASGVVACLLTGSGRLTPGQVDTVRRYLKETATTGKFKAGPSGSLPDRLLYFDPTHSVSPFLSPGPGLPKRHWRLTITDNNGNATFTVVGELELSEVVGTAMDGSDETGAGLGTASASSFSSADTVVANAFNNTYTTGSTSAAGRYWSSATPNEQYIGWDFGEGVTKDINQVRMLCDREANRAPKNMVVQSSDDGVVWTTEWAIAPQTAWTVGEWRSFNRP